MDRYRVITTPEEKQAVAFCAANGLVAADIPADDGLRIVDDVIHYRTMARIYDTMLKSPWKTTPLVSPPEEYGLATREVVAIEAITDRLLAALIEDHPETTVDGAVRTVLQRQARALAQVVQDLIATEVSR